MMDPEKSLEVLDAYEGCGRTTAGPAEFERGIGEATLGDGSTVKAWVYWYKGSHKRARRIGSGDYLSALR